MKGQVFISVLVVALVLMSVSGAVAQGVGPSGATIPYTGRLTDDAGQAVPNGSYGFTFALYDAVESGNLLWSEIQTDVVVQDGSFTALLGSVKAMPSVAKDGKLWLEVSVRGPGESTFTALTPRQELSATSPKSPASPAGGGGLACPHTHLYEDWPGTSNTYGFLVENAGTGDGVRSLSHATASNYAAFYGYNTGAGAGMYGGSTTGAGVYGVSSSGRGLMGASTSADGIDGTTSATGLSGIYGHATNSFGVTGASTNSFGLQGRGNDASGDDFLGDIWLDGARGEILTGERLNLQSKWNVNVEIDKDNNDTDGKFNVYPNNTAVAVFSVDQLGNTVAAGTKSAQVQTADYGQRLLYAVESSEVWFEDLGTAALEKGAVMVPIDAMFAETVNLSDYHVFVTPICENPVVLYITSKTPAGFTVKGVSLDGQSSSCSFDYRIVAKRLGYEDVRMATPALQSESPK